MKNRLDAFLVLLLLGGGAAALYRWRYAGEEGVSYTVQPGDTLFVIAQTHQVTVEQIRQWNHLEGDLIEVGQLLRLYPEGAAAPPPSAGGPAPKAAEGPPPAKEDGKRKPKLSAPTPEPCVPFEADPGEEGVVAPAGLSHAQVKGALDRVLPEALYCEGAPEGSASLMFTVTVGCDGVVDAVSGSGGAPAPFLDCVTAVIRSADFPAHDMEGGMTFTYPVNVSF